MKQFKLFTKKNIIIAASIIILLLVVVLFLGMIYLSKSGGGRQVSNSMDDIFSIKPSKFKGENIWF